jgi:hypothetical protein
MSWRPSGHAAYRIRGALSHRSCEETNPHGPPTTPTCGRGGFSWPLAPLPQPERMSVGSELEKHESMGFTGPSGIVSRGGSRRFAIHRVSYTHGVSIPCAMKQQVDLEIF